MYSNTCHYLANSRTYVNSNLCVVPCLQLWMESILLHFDGMIRLNDATKASEKCDIHGRPRGAQRSFDVWYDNMMRLTGLLNCHFRIRLFDA